MGPDQLMVPQPGKARKGSQSWEVIRPLWLGAGFSPKPRFATWPPVPKAAMVNPGAHPTMRLVKRMLNDELWQWDGWLLVVDGDDSWLVMIDG